MSSHYLVSSFNNGSRLVQNAAGAISTITGGQSANLSTHWDCLPAGSDDPGSPNFDPDCITNSDYENWLEEYIMPTPLEWLFITILSIFFAVGIVGNALVIYVVVFKPNMRTVTNLFLLNLAVADFQVVTVVLPFTVLWDVTETWFLGTALCKIILYSQNLSVYVSVLSLTAISVERWYAICRPLSFRTTFRRTISILVLIWCVSSIIALPELILLEAKPFSNFAKANFTSILITSCEDTKLGENGQMIYLLLQALLFYLLPLCIMAVMYGQIAYHLWMKAIPCEAGGCSNMALTATKCRTKSTKRSSSAALPLGQQDTNVIREIQSRRKAAKMLIMVVTLFGTCFLPTHVLNILKPLQLSRYINEDVHSVILSISRLLCYFNSVFNPIIYNFMSEKFRREFSNAFRCCSLCCNNKKMSKDYESVNMATSKSNSHSPHTHRFTTTNNAGRRTTNSAPADRKISNYQSVELEKKLSLANNHLISEAQMCLLQKDSESPVT